MLCQSLPAHVAATLVRTGVPVQQRDVAADPEAILRRFARSDVMHPTYKALAELGRLPPKCSIGINQIL
ncbi:Tn3 family transposase (plasmid) [Roseibium aggregatum]|nr:Tn3 family transposase [Roseibium aggregatum]